MYYEMHHMCIHTYRRTSSKSGGETRTAAADAGGDAEGGGLTVGSGDSAAPSAHIGSLEPVGL